MTIFTKRSTAGIALALCVAVAALGCQTYGGSAALGSALGAGAGAIIGNQSGHAGEGALIGAVLGAATGLIVKDIQVRRTKSAAETAALHKYTPDEGIKVYPESAQCTPSAVKRGQDVKTTMEYAVLSGGKEVPVKETRVLEKDGKQVAELSQKDFTRTDGTWVSELEFTVPKDAARASTKCGRPWSCRRTIRPSRRT
jgi:hypothetical protein